MTWVLLAVAVLVASGLVALVVGRSARAATLIGVGGAVSGGVLGLVPAVRVLCGAPVESLQVAWAVPYGSFAVELDVLSAFFLVPVLGLSALAAVYGGEYLRAWAGRKSLGASWFFYNLLVASMVLVVLARNAVLFLVAWELMALTSFFLVIFEDEQPAVRAAGWIYLVASHLGTAFLLAMFVLLGRDSGGLDFDRFRSVATPGLVFVLALIGFGTKAGFLPLHVWLPEAHPAAPSHVSAVMSGVMIKMGIYGLLRTLMFLGAPAAWWGWLLIGVGLASAAFGVLFALAQADLKRLLAYSSVENIGIIATGMGLGLLGLSHGAPVLAVLGFSGALLHVINHTCFKGLLFLGAGAVLHGTGTRRIDQLGGLLKPMRLTGAAFLVGAVAIAALPPLNGFVSEFLIYLGAYRAGAGPDGGLAVAGLVVIAVLALSGGLVAACFTKAFGIVFLGEPRSDRAAHTHEPGLAMRVPMAVLAAGCVVLGLGAPVVVPLLGPVVGSVSGLASVVVAEQLEDVSVSLRLVALVGGGVVALVILLALLRKWLLAGRRVARTVTWDCGYARPTSRMQYTGSSFVQPLTELFAALLRSRRKLAAPKGIFPADASLAIETPDVVREAGYRPLFTGVEAALGRLRWLQQGRIQLYVLYIALTLLALLIWKLGWAR